MVTVLRAEEYETQPVDASLLFPHRNLQLYPEAQSKGCVGLRFSKNRLELQAGGVLGVIPLNDDVVLEVTPRVPIARLEEIVRRSGSAPFVPLPYDRGFAPSADEFIGVDDLVAERFRSTLGELAFEGLFKTYRQQSECGQSPRGRILPAATYIKLRTSLRPAAEYEYFGRTIDNPINQMILFAGQHLIEMQEHRAGKTTKLSLALKALLEMFTGVQHVTPDQLSADPPLPSNRPVLEQAVELSKLILFRNGVRFFGEGRVRLPSFLINMETVFEEYVRAVLRNSSRLTDFEILDGNTKPPHGAASEIFEVAGDLGNHATKPDIVVRHAGRILCVGDVKYKPCPKQPDRANLEQVLVYGLSYKAPIAMLLYPCAAGQGTTLEFLGKVDGIECYKSTLQLMSEGLDAEEQKLTSLLADLFAKKGCVGISA